MGKECKYIPIFRGRAEENAVLKSFDFGRHIFPCLEIIKETFTANSRKTFDEVYLPFIKGINAAHVLVDIPSHFSWTKNTKTEVVSFLRRVAQKRTERRHYYLKLSRLSNKIIPVISTLYHVNNEENTIVSQEVDLRSAFPRLAFRTFPKSFKRDFKQIKKVITSEDFVIVDFAEMDIDMEDPDIIDIQEALEEFDKCPVVVVHSPVPHNLSNKELPQGKRIPQIDNALLKDFRTLNADCYGDYVGIKKDVVPNGGGISPGFVYYNALDNNFYGYRGNVLELDEFEETIVPMVINAKITLAMQTHSRKYISDRNPGYMTIENIFKEFESGKSMAKFKRISMNHYIHCMKIMVTEGDFD